MSDSGPSQLIRRFARSVSHRIDDIVRTVVIQGIMTDILHVQEQNDKAFSDWHENGGLIR